jgi:hypothetical protein
MGKHSVQSIVNRYVYSFKKDKNYFKRKRREEEIDEVMDARREEMQPEEAPEQEVEEIEEEIAEPGVWDLAKWLVKEMADFIELAAIAGLISLPAAYIVEGYLGVNFKITCSCVGLLVASVSLAMRHASSRVR